MIDRIISYLAQGFSQASIAEMVDVTPSYISQVISDPAHASLIQAEQARLKLTQVNVKLEEKYLDLEEKLLHHVKEQMPFAEFRDLTHTMEILIKRKQQQALKEQSSFVVNGNAQFNTVVLSIPRAAAPEITLNSNREVIAIGDKSLAPMQASSVRKLFATLEAKRLQASKALPHKVETVTEEEF